MTSGFFAVIRGVRGKIRALVSGLKITLQPLSRFLLIETLEREWGSFKIQLSKKTHPNDKTLFYLTRNRKSAAKLATISGTAIRT